MKTILILVAAGRGERMRADRPKAFIDLAGRPLLLQAACPFEQAADIDAVVAVVPAGTEARARDVLAPVSKLVAVVAGGERRQDSVWAGLAQAPEGFDGVVLVHDAARPFVDLALIQAVVQGAWKRGAAVPVVPIVDTVKRLSQGQVLGTLDREELAAVQTPQGFRFSLLERAYTEARRLGLTLTDEAMAVERLGVPVAAIAGLPQNRKLTTPEDLEWAEWRARVRGRV
jgi:2-C-methyl-D-erythritol 4-phosphate cytidylyltransferase